MPLGTVVIGGGSGFIGRAISRNLKNIGYEVLIVSRQPGLGAMSWNELAQDGLPSSCEAVINVAGQNVLDPRRRWTPGFQQNVYASRINTTRLLAQEIENMSKPPKVFGVISGVENALDKNNPFKGRTTVPTFSEPLTVPREELWDEELADGFSLNGIEPPTGAIIEPQPMSKPAERRRLYKELHRYPLEANKENKSSPPKPSPVPRQPKQPSETQRLQNVSQKASSETIQNLGLGRGRSTRIAANIFDNSNGVTTGANSSSYSNIVKDMSNLGFGRGMPVNQNPIPFLDDDDFPALGCGRGVLNAPKQNLRTPGMKPKK